MKTIKKIGLIAFITLSFVLTSCSSDSNGGSSTGTGSYITAKVGGESFQTIEVQGNSTASAIKTTVGDHTFITISGSAMSTNTIVITLDNITAAGTYTLNPSSDSALSYFDTATSTAFVTSDCDGATGTLVVTSIDATKIEGTFTFTGKNQDNCSNTKTVTEGKFRGIFQTN